ncbi:MAG TPA: protein kinase [Blastocatellia bacterium]|nr:protein kinase [Blastocatellia bacterium]
MESADRLKQVAELFHAALERAPDERAAFLAEACASDPDLLKQVQSFLAAQEQVSGFLDEPGLIAARESTAQFEVGRPVGHYRVVTLIGRGGMGEVYLAQDTRLHRRVALKLLRASLTEDRQRLKRFEQEACAASALSHPNILTVHDFGQDGDLHFIVSEYIEGETLRQALKRGQLSFGQALEAATQVAGALAAAHQAGIVHRDIKPENIMLRPDGYVKVLDFGLAKLGERADAPPGLSAFSVIDTHPGMVMGTVNYMSPEQARGLAVDARSDVFSLGAVLYEMLSGRPPFDGETASDVLVGILEKEPLPLAVYWPDTPPELQRIVSKTLQKDREERYQSIKDLHLDLKYLKRDLASDARLEQRLAQKSSGAIAAAGSGPALAASTRPNLSANTWRSRSLQLTGVIKRHKLGAILAFGGLLLAVGGPIYLASRARPPNTTAAAHTAAGPTSNPEPANGMAILLRDEFDDGDIGSNSAPGGVGSGFELRSIAGSGSVVEAGGTATISGTATIKTLQSKDAFEPTGKTLTWVISKRSPVAASGVTVGWVQANKAPCCDPSVELGIEGNRVVFDLQAKTYEEPFQPHGRYLDIPLGSTAANAIYTNPGSPITASVYVDTTQWKIDVTGDGVDIHQSGDYVHCPKPVKGECISLNDVLVQPGVNRRMRAFAFALRENVSATFDSVVIAGATPSPDLAVTLSRADNFKVGVESNYTITVTNQGQGSTTGEITLTDILPPGVNFFSSKATGWFCAPVSQTITCTRSVPLEAGQATSLVFTVMPTRAGSAVNAVSVSTPQDSTTGAKSASDQTVIRDQP